MTAAEVRKRVEEFRDEAERIMNLFSEPGGVPREKIPKAQEMFRALKDELRAEYKRTSKVREQSRLTEVEAEVYKPAMMGAWANTLISSIRWNSRPDQHWHDALWNVADYMDSGIDDLE